MNKQNAVTTIRKIREITKSTLAAQWGKILDEQVCQKIIEEYILNYLRYPQIIICANCFNLKTKTKNCSTCANTLVIPIPFTEIV